MKHSLLDSSQYDESNGGSFIFLGAIDAELCDKIIHPNFCIKLTILYILGIKIYKYFCICILRGPGTHNHPPPPPERTPVGIRDELQTMIQNIITSDDSVTPRSIIAKNNSINATFDKDTLSEVHALLNNVDKLRTLVAKCYKNMHPYGQGNLGVMHSVQCKKFDMHNYVRRIEQFEDGQTLILCMLDFQAKALQNLKCFQIDLTFKRVQGDINEFKVNSYDEMHKLILSYCRIYTNIFTANAYQRLFTQLFEVIENLSEKPVKFYHINGTGWECILGDLDPGQAKAKKFDNEVHLLAKSIPTRSSVEEVHECFKKLELYDNKRIIDWVQYYRQPYVLASLNKYISNMENEIWDRHENNTNIAEAAHAQANREGKQLKLLTAIMRGRRLDERLFKIAEINDKFGVLYTRRNKSEIKRKAKAMSRKDTNANKKSRKDTSEESKIPMQDITNREQPKRGKRKNTTSENNLKSKKIKIDIDDSNDEQETTSENNSKTKQTNKTKIDIDSSNEEQEIIKLEIEERKMKLAERRTADRKAQAEIEKLELENLKLRKELNILNM
ncbi:unnamed protein product [Rhizophagus irregularis]|nr:unnamed protein product [Rhizophagus irregularis]